MTTGNRAMRTGNTITMSNYLMNYIHVAISLHSHHSLLYFNGWLQSTTPWVDGWKSHHNHHQPSTPEKNTGETAAIALGSWGSSTAIWMPVRPVWPRWFGWCALAVGPMVAAPSRRLKRGDFAWWKTPRISGMPPLIMRSSLVVCSFNCRVLQCDFLRFLNMLIWVWLTNNEQAQGLSTELVPTWYMSLSHGQSCRSSCVQILNLDSLMLLA